MRRLNVLKIFLFLTFLSPSLSAFAEAISLISDVDDTVRVSHTNSFGSIGRVLWGSNAFAGMPLLYQRLLSDRNEYQRKHMYFVTGSPDLLYANVSGFLSTHGFPSYELYMKPIVGSKSLQEFKESSVREIMAAWPKQDRVIFFGDNTQSDQAVYANIKQERPAQVLASYIHQIKEKDVLQGTPFYTAMDIALFEEQAGRLNVDDLLAILEDLLMTDSYELIIPEYAACPKTEWLSKILANSNANTSNLVGAPLAELERNILQFCKDRKQED